ncbi:MAG TPA: glycosyltransferase family 9 protein [Myxococcota bacterium]|nr:glycosyltransferase family 9 protein [Myxococcota bacterium]
MFADRVLLIRLGAMGDVVRTLPAAACLRQMHPGAHLAWLVEPAAAGVVEASGLVDETLVFPRGELVAALRAADALAFGRCLGGFLRRLRARRFELVLDFHGLLKSGLLARLSGAPVRYGFGRGVARELSDVFVNRHVQLPSRGVSRFDRNAALVAALVPDAELPAHPLLAASPIALARMVARLRISGREQASRFVLLHPGSSAGARHKRYATAGWAAVARRLAASGLEVWVACGAGREERQLADEVLRAAGGAAHAAPETRAFDDLLALLARAAVFASADTGPLHAASLAGVPVVQLLGPTDPIQNAPWAATPWRRVHYALPCSPCRRGCADPACMRAIPPARVADAILELARLADRPALSVGGTQASTESGAEGGA